MPTSFNTTVVLGLAALSQGLLSACGGHSTGATQPEASGGNTSAAGTGTNATSGTSGTSGSGTGGGRAGGGSGVSPGSGGGAGRVGDSGGAGTTAGSGGDGGETAAGGSATCPNLPSAPVPASSIIQFNDNGGWNWFQDERAVVDKANNKFVIGSVASGGARDGAIEAVVYDIAAASKALYTLDTGLASTADDHNAPAFLVRPDGKYLAMWAGHRIDCNSRTSIFDGTAWSAASKFSWTPLGCPWAGWASNMITYANPWYVGSSILSAVRSVGTDPAFLTSPDDGETWSYYGRLTATGNVGFVGGYYKYWGNNSDRIDFVGSEAHPRDADTSLYHGFIKDGVVYDSAGVVKDAMLSDSSSTSSAALYINSYTPVFKTGATINGLTLEHAWNHDIVRYADGTIASLGQARVHGTGSDDPDKRLLYFRFDGTSWKTTYLVKAGPKLFPDEQDFTGLSALHPDNPHVIFISTTVDPRDDTTLLGKHEIFEGMTCDDGRTWQWTPLTQNSTVDNLRPVVPRWDSNHTLLLWLRGTYISAQKYLLEVVGTTTGL